MYLEVINKIDNVLQQALRETQGADAESEEEEEEDEDETEDEDDDEEGTTIHLEISKQGVHRSQIP